MSQLARIFEIDRRLRANECPSPEALAVELEVSRRQIFHDRRFMVEQLGAPIGFHRERGGWTYTDPTWVLPATWVSEGELLAFFLSVEVASHHLGSAWEKPLRRAVEKISRGMQGPVSVDLNTLNAHYTFTAPPAARAEEATLLALHQAIAQRRVLHLRYFTAGRGEWNDRLVHPHHLHQARGEWLLIAFDRGRAKMLTFNAARIEECRVLDEGFARDATFDVSAWMHATFATESREVTVEVAVRFDPYQARYIREREWHAGQNLEESADGGLVLRFPAGGLDEVARWVLQYGAHAEVLEPPELRALVAAQVRELARLYG